MIKFFRKIRQNLLIENKTGKYFKYAIGEIVLVVIGILIALNINNWNENRKAMNAEIALYTVILKDIEFDDGRINLLVDYYTQMQYMHQHMYKETIGLESYDSIIPYGELRTTRAYDLIIKNNHSDNFKLITNDTIKQNLKDYFRNEDYVKGAMLNLNSYKIEHLRPMFSRYGIDDNQVLYDNLHLGYFELIKKKHTNHSKLKEQYGTVEFDGLLFNLGVKTNWTLEALNMLKKEGQKLKNSLENELIDK